MELVIETEIQCPACGEVFPTTVDTSQGDYTAIEDCTVCCRPMQLQITCQPGEIVEVRVEPS